MCVILSANPAFATAAPESPPPIIVVASKSANVFAISFVPIANWSNSNSPNGPFQITVFAFFNSFLNISIVFSPISNPSQPSGMSVHATVLLSVSGLNSFPIFVSIGNNNFTPFCFAFFIASNAKPVFSSSHSELPTLYP